MTRSQTGRRPKDYPPEHPAVRQVKRRAMDIRNDRRALHQWSKHRDVLEELAKEAGYPSWPEYRTALSSGKAMPPEGRR